MSTRHIREELYKQWRETLEKKREHLLEEKRAVFELCDFDMQPAEFDKIIEAQTIKDMYTEFINQFGSNASVAIIIECIRPVAIETGEEKYAHMLECMHKYGEVAFKIWKSCGAIHYHANSDIAYLDVSLNLLRERLQGDDQLICRNMIAVLMRETFRQTDNLHFCSMFRAFCKGAFVKYLFD